ncbi:hypothetical protein D3C84_604620 [compost metagenome]
MRQPFEHPGHRFADHVNHHQTGEQAGQQRNDQNRFERLEAVGQTHPAADRLGAVTGEKTGDDATDKPGAQGTGQQTTDHPRRQARTVGNRVGDVTGEQRHHQFERRVATDLHQRGRQGARLLEGLNPEHEGQGDQQTARHHHRQHERDPGEQVLVHPGFLAAGRTGIGALRS